jgi:hypothetical protein
MVRHLHLRLSLNPTHRNSWNGFDEAGCPSSGFYKASAVIDYRLASVRNNNNQKPSIDRKLQ